MRFKKGSIKKRAAEGVLYTGIFTAASKAINIIQLAVLARFLTPEDFGINVLATVVLTAATTFTALGTERLIIQRVELDDEFLGTAWSVIILRGLLISSVSLVLAPIYGIWSGNPAVTPILLIASAGPFLSSFISPLKFVHERELDFKRLTYFEICADLSTFIVLTVLAYYLRSVYALAIGNVLMACVRAVLSWVWFGWRLRPRLKMIYLRELFRFGRNFFIIALGTFVMTQCDNLYVGKVLGATMLGYYALGFKISQIVIDVLKKVLGRVAFPLFSKLQIDRDQLQETFLYILNAQLGLIFPLVGFVYIFSEPIVTLFLGIKYAPVVPILKAMTLLTLGRGVSNILVPLIIGTGNISFASRIKVVETTLFLAAIVLGGYYFNVVGVAIGAGIGYVFAALFRIIFVTRLLNISFQEMVNSAMIPFIITTVASIFTTLVLKVEIMPNNIINFCFAVSVFVGAVLVLYMIFQRQFIIGCRKLLLNK